MMAVGIRAWQSYRDMQSRAVVDDSAKGYRMVSEPCLNGPCGYLWHMTIPEGQALDYLVALEGDGFRVDLSGDNRAFAYRWEERPESVVQTEIRFWFGIPFGSLESYPEIEAYTPVRVPGFIGDPQGDGERGDLFADCSYRA